MIESDLSRIATALELIAAALSSSKPTKAAKDTPAPVAVQAPVPTPVVAPVVSAPVMPAAPFPVAATPVVPVVAPVVVAAPAPVVAAPAPVVAAPVVSTPAVFSSKEEMTQFVINSYRALGAEKGALIQGVLTAMGYANINDVDPVRWGELKAGIEALAK